MNSEAFCDIKKLQEILRKFNDARDWKQFHDPKNLAEAISIEAAELQELFLWKDVPAVVEKIKNDPSFRAEIEEEFADVVIFALNFANVLDINVIRAVKTKIEKNNIKYPVEKARGTADKYDKL
jgi:NTP pyrophosphatase (non-canonical NTP hydrolase)